MNASGLFVGVSWIDRVCYVYMQVDRQAVGLVMVVESMFSLK